MQSVFEASDVEVRRATAADAQAIGAVFDAAVRVGWAYLGELAERPMFAPEDWDRLVADHAPPNVLLVATDQAGRVLGYSAAHPEHCELFLLFVDPAYAGRGVGRTLLNAAHEALRAAGCTQVFLFTHEQNLTGNRRLHEGGLSPRRIDPRIGLQGHRHTRAATRKGALTPVRCHPAHGLAPA